LEGLNRPLTAAVVAGAAITAALAGPTAALACNSGTSAVNVYKECLQNGGGGSTSPPKTSTVKGSASGSGSGSGSASGSTTPHVSGQTKNALSHAGKDKGALTSLVTGTGLRRHLLATGPSGSTSTPSAVGSAFDLTSGPTALLLVLVGTAVLIIGGSGMRVLRNRHRA
jgi:hypothetical protein